jgi:hypothetical protein
LAAKHPLATKCWQKYSRQVLDDAPNSFIFAARQKSSRVRMVEGVPNKIREKVCNNFDVKIRRGVRVVEGARLESVYTERYRGFESLPLLKQKTVHPQGCIFNLFGLSPKFTSVRRMNKLKMSEAK